MRFERFGKRIGHVLRDVLLLDLLQPRRMVDTARNESSLRSRVVVFYRRLTRRPDVPEAVGERSGQGFGRGALISGSACTYLRGMR